MIIRPYRIEDKPVLQEICRITAHKSFCKNEKQLKAVTILYNDYYTECEPENIFVATDESDKPIGYILCCCDWKKFIHEIKSVYKVRLSSVCPSRLPELFSARLLINLLPKKYRPHLHIDILPDYQRKGIGTLLIDRLREHLRNKNIPFLSVLSVSTHSDGYRFYKKYGFRTVRRWIPTESALSVSTAEK